MEPNFLNLSDPLVFEHFGGAKFWERKDFAAGAMVIAEDENSQDFYYILSGRVEISKSVKHAGRPEKALANLKPGDFFGEGSLLSERVRSATVRASEACVLLKLSHKKFVQLVVQDPEAAMGITLGIVKGLNARLYKTNERLVALYNVARLIPHYKGDQLQIIAAIFAELKEVLQGSETALFAMDGLAKFKTEGMNEKTLAALQGQIPDCASQFAHIPAPPYVLIQGQVFQPIHDASGALLGVLVSSFNGDFQEEDLHLLGIIAEQLGVVLANKQ
jgi:CRP-like cAMP-binding protein